MAQLHTQNISGCVLKHGGSFYCLIFFNHVAFHSHPAILNLIGSIFLFIFYFLLTCLVKQASRHLNYPSTWYNYRLSHGKIYGVENDVSSNLSVWSRHIRSCGPSFTSRTHPFVPMNLRSRVKVKPFMAILYNAGKHFSLARKHFEHCCESQHYFIHLGKPFHWVLFMLMNSVLVNHKCNPMRIVIEKTRVNDEFLGFVAKSAFFLTSAL